ncbi:MULTISPECIES: cupin domain-containing protein [unclassified Thioalkalivibrio]|uniref:cupin domain-containing protein n=1 Tax=unclassified Thioalkalivibrio TaxID=2621013 RepID=UPI00037DD8F2|nr:MULTISPECIES: cupin domain-containing protein [unclassified Thioalkalivibrio]
MYDHSIRPTGALRHLATTAAALALAIPLAGMAADDGQAFIWEPDAPDLEWNPCPAFMPDDCRLAILQGDPAEPNADVFFRLPGNSTAPHHWHTSAERMVLVQGEMQVDYDDQEPVVLRPGTYAYGPPRLAHTTHCISDEDCILFIAFEEPVDAHETHGH